MSYASDADFSWLTNYMQYGPLGLAGLFFTVVMITVITGGVGPAKERIVKRILAVGFFCFIAALIEQYLAPPADLSQQIDTLEHVSMDLENALPWVNMTITALTSPSCPNGPRMAQDSEKVLNKIKTSKDSIDSVVRSLSSLKSGAPHTILPPVSPRG
jgi:hypothetical protein